MTRVAQRVSTRVTMLKPRVNTSSHRLHPVTRLDPRRVNSRARGDDHGRIMSARSSLFVCKNKIVLFTKRILPACLFRRLRSLFLASKSRDFLVCFRASGPHEYFGPRATHGTNEQVLEKRATHRTLWTPRKKQQSRGKRNCGEKKLFALRFSLPSQIPRRNGGSTVSVCSRRHRDPWTSRQCTFKSSETSWMGSGYVPSCLFARAPAPFVAPLADQNVDAPPTGGLQHRAA